jgi:hypothetical protein
MTRNDFLVSNQNQGLEGCLTFTVLSTPLFMFAHYSPQFIPPAVTAPAEHEVDIVGHESDVVGPNSYAIRYTSQKEALHHTSTGKS